MKLKNKNIAFCLTGSFYTLKNTIIQMKELVKEGANVIPIISYNVYKTDTKYGKAKDFVKEIKETTSNSVIHTINEAEQVNYKYRTDIIIVAPCTGNTISKLSNGIMDTPVLVAIKSHLMDEKPLVIAISTNDGLSRKCRKHRKIT